MEHPRSVDEPRSTGKGASRAGMDRGEIVNLVAELRRRLAAKDGIAKLTDVQNRLVMQRLKEKGTWEEPRETVEEQIAEIGATIEAVTGFTQAEIEGHIAACHR